MLFELRNALHEEDDSTVLDDIRTLLGVLRRRKDVTYPIATEIDTILRDEVADVQPHPGGVTRRGHRHRSAATSQRSPASAASHPIC